MLTHKVKSLRRARSGENSFRVWLNNYLEKMSFELNSNHRVLDVGKSLYWDYTSLFENYKTLDKNPKVCPDIVGDITNCKNISDNSFDLIVCYGIHEYIHKNLHWQVSSEIYRILSKNGVCIFCIASSTYPFCDSEVLQGLTSEESRRLLSNFKILEEENFKDLYFCFVCKKETDVWKD